MTVRQPRGNSNRLPIVPNASSSASSSQLSRTRSPSFQTSLPRCEGANLDHGPLSNDRLDGTIDIVLVALCQVRNRR